MSQLRHLLAVILASGCAVFDDGSYTPSESQLKWNNPNLLNFPADTIATCDGSGGRINVSLSCCVSAHSP